MRNSESRALVVTGAAGRARPDLTRNVRAPAPFIVQLAASHAGIGPYRTRFREVPAIALASYRTVEMSDRSRN